MGWRNLLIIPRKDFCKSLVSALLKYIPIFFLLLVIRILPRTSHKRHIKKDFTPVSHCIFDFDGTLVNTEVIYAQVFEEYLSEHGHHYTPNIHRKILGSTNDNAWRIITSELKLKTPWQTSAKEFRTRCYERLGNCPLLPGVEKLLRHLSDSKIPLAIASSAAEMMFARKSGPHRELFKVFHHVVCGGTDPEVKNSKPSPEVFVVCARRFDDKPNPKDCLAFEDAPNGVVAAISAGMQCVAIPDKQVPREAFRDATLIVNSMEEFAPERFGLPSYVVK